MFRETSIVELLQISGHESCRSQSKIGRPQSLYQLLIKPASDTELYMEGMHLLQLRKTPLVDLPQATRNPRKKPLEECERETPTLTKPLKKNTPHPGIISYTPTYDTPRRTTGQRKFCWVGGQPPSHWNSYLPPRTKWEHICTIRTSAL